MYVKLIQPKMIKRPMNTDIKLHMAPPLGLLTIVNLLREEHVVSLENENIQSIDYTDKPDIVGISVTVDTLPGAIRIAKEFRDKGITVVAGGIHITTAYDTIPQDVFDVLCIGAAERTYRHFFRLAYRVSFPRKVDRTEGICGGILFHAFIKASFTHSCASSAL